MAITNRQGLADFALRQLGGGVVNIEMSADQMDDAVELAVQFFRDYHYDGVERDYLVVPVTATTITVAAISTIAVGDTLTSSVSLNQVKVLSITGNEIIISRQIGDRRIAVAEVLTNQNGVTATVTVVSEGLIDKHYITTDETVMSITKVLNLSNILATNYLVNPQYQFMVSELQNIMSGQTQYLYGVMNYMGHLDFILRKEKDFRFNRYMGKLYFDINWDSDVNLGENMVVEIYRYVDDADYEAVLNDQWLKKYTTALFKRQWGTNLKKYTGMTLPGGMTFNGQQIYDEAINEIKELEDIAMNQSSPLQMLVG